MILVIIFINSQLGIEFLPATLQLYLTVHLNIIIYIEFGIFLLVSFKRQKHYFEYILHILSNDFEIYSRNNCHVLIYFY